jgi:hypothetical protein
MVFDDDIMKESYFLEYFYQRRDRNKYGVEKGRKEDKAEKRSLIAG